MNVSEQYRDLKHHKSFDIFKDFGIVLLKETLEGFFSCKVSFMYEPIEQAKKSFNIDLLDHPNRGCYPIDEDNFFIYARILDSNELISGIGLVLQGHGIADNKNFLNSLEGALTKRFSESYSNWFKDCSIVFGDSLIEHAMSNFCVRGYFDYRQFHHLLSYFKNLKATTFEGESFSTGLIITKAYYEYENENEYDRNGHIYPLKKRESLLNTLAVNRRFWFLADGKKTFFVANKNLDVSHLFVVDNEAYLTKGYIENHTLSLTLRGGDTLFKIENQKQFSIINSDGTEFLSLENRWKLRNYNSIKKLFRKHIDDTDVINKLINFVLHCSKNSISSLIWVPTKDVDYSEYVKPNTLNKLIDHSINILDKRFEFQIIRYLSSDGASIINTNGELIHYGAIVDNAKSEMSGVSGTGESAAGNLSDNGFALKISEDGTIKFYSGEGKPIYI